MKLWIQKIWAKYSNALFINLGMLVWNQFIAHTTEPTKKFREEINTELTIILGDLTSPLQFLDVSDNKPLKNFMPKE